MAAASAVFSAAGWLESHDTNLNPNSAASLGRITSALTAFADVQHSLCKLCIALPGTGVRGCRAFEYGSSRPRLIKAGAYAGYEASERSGLRSLAFVVLSLNECTASVWKIGTIVQRLAFSKPSLGVSYPET